MGYVVAVSIAVLGYTWLHYHDKSVREAALAKQSRDSLVTVAAETARYQRIEHTRDSLEAVAIIKQRDAALQGLRRYADSVAHATGALLDSVAIALPDTLEPIVARLRASWDAEREAWARERGAADSALSARNVALRQIESAYDHDISEVRVQLAEAIRQLDVANRRASPSLGKRIVTSLPYIAGAYLVGRLTK
jgi:hypothetical protein